MSAHTPGPWELMPVEDRSINHLCPVDGEKLSILTVVEQDGVFFAAVYKDEDARLIGAAPELLAALEGLVAWANDLRRNDPAKDLANARAAIAKAKGETP